MRQRANGMFEQHHIDVHSWLKILFDSAILLLVSARSFKVLSNSFFR